MQRKFDISEDRCNDMKTQLEKANEEKKLLS